ncbi:hypothetical protein [Pinibacter aurantiacus]|uniref:Outer membrane protein beta-barrel domain-containing protein n=1 Tax=Pinibacter aurantiacus TaxID=2851599 RepID=A0A9E2W8Z1_9BACT|nr:hypothetical protein [Pinibacter aurantiacus]MBV4358907.1 hypothetical protein [Pinibacter aurantiacus]
MRLLILVVCSFATLFAASAFGQDSSLKARLPKIDSILPGNGLNNIGNQVSSDAIKKKVLASGKVVMEPVSELESKIKLFDKNTIVKPGEIGLTASYNYLYDTSAAFNGIRGVAAYDVSLGASIVNMPFNLHLKGNDGLYTYDQTPLNDFYKFNFDHTKYMDILRAKVLEKISAEKIMAAGMNRINAIRAEYEQSLNKEIAAIKGEYEKKYNRVLQLPSQSNSLSGNDLSSLRSKIIPDSVYNKYSQSAMQYQELLKSGTGNGKDSLKAIAFQKAKGDVEQYEALQKIYGKITAYKDKFENNKLVKELRSNLPLNSSNIKSYLSDPSNLKSAIENNAEISGLQKLFMSVSRLDVGQNPVQSGDFGFKNVVNNGINTEFQTKSKTFGFIYGRNNTSSQWLQQGLTSAVSDYSSMTGLKFGSAPGSAVQQNISLNFFDFNNNVTDRNKILGIRSTDLLPTARHKDAVISYHTSFGWGLKNKVDFDLSKSFGSYQNNFSSDTIVSNKTALSNKGMSDIGGKVNYEGEVFKTDVNVFVKKVGLGYNNPGNVNLRRGESQVGLSLGRKFYKQKINVRFATDFRKQKFDPNNNYFYTSFNTKFQLGYKFNRNSRVNLTYQRTGYNTQMIDEKSNKGFTSRLQADGSYGYKLFNKRILNNVVVSNQKQNIPTVDTANYRNSSLMIMHTSSVVLGKNILSLSLLMNKAKSQDYLFSTSMFNAETNYSYSIQKLRMASGIGYYSNAGWNQQLGLKQQLSTQLLEKLNIDFEIGYKKAVKVIRTEFANQLFGSAIIHYTL